MISILKSMARKATRIPPSDPRRRLVGSSPAAQLVRIRRLSIGALVAVFVIASISSMALLHPYIYGTFLSLERDDARKQ